MNYQFVVKRIAVSAVTAAAVLGLAGMALASEFSADIKQTGTDGKATMKGKIYVKGVMERTEYAAPEGKIIVIKRPAKGLTWMLSPHHKMCSEVQVGNPRPKLVSSVKAILEIMPNQRKVGSVKIAGYMCDKYTYSIGSKCSGIVYISSKLQHELKRDDQETWGRMGYVLSNIKEIKLPNSLFNIPSGYKKTIMPSIPKQPNMPAKEGIMEKLRNFLFNK